MLVKEENKEASALHRLGPAQEEETQTPWQGYRVRCRANTEGGRGSHASASGEFVMNQE